MNHTFMYVPFVTGIISVWKIVCQPVRRIQNTIFGLTMITCTDYNGFVQKQV
ncbi:MAG: hypothetical protein HZA08_11715 [Nitrospirae bacterium]|nr:hypothetical protein [Nitrospirota bacterium]